MQPSKLKQVLIAFETANGSLALPQLAQELQVSPQQLEGMIQYWVRKGKIRESSGLTDCGSCGSNGSCAFVMDMPRGYELATNNNNMISLQVISGPCTHRTKT